MALTAEATVHIGNITYLRLFCYAHCSNQQCSIFTTLSAIACLHGTTAFVFPSADSRLLRRSCRFQSTVYNVREIKLNDWNIHYVFLPRFSGFMYFISLLSARISEGILLKSSRTRQTPSCPHSTLYRVLSHKARTCSNKLTDAPQRLSALIRKPAPGFH